MTLRNTYIMLTIGLSSLGILSAQNDVVLEANEEEVDSSWHFDNSFGKQLAIQSYEELLETFYNAVVIVDSKLNFNAYRLQPGNTEEVNPFIYRYIIFPENTQTDLEAYNSNFNRKTPFEGRAEDVLLESRSYIAQTNPELITATWDLLPDPPDTEKKADIIQNVNLDMSQIDRRSRKINTPEKIEKQNYAYIPWEYKVVSSLTASQTAFSNWGKGGSNSFSLSGRIIADADYISSDKKIQWQNNIETRLGYLQQEDKPFVKNLDLFSVNSQYARNAVNKWFYAINTEFTTQFFEGYNIKKDNYEDPISALLAPAYLNVSIGMDYKYGTKENKKIFSVQASPLSYKLTYVRDTSKIDQENYGIEADKTNRQEIGGSVKLKSNYSYNDKVTTSSSLLFFSNYVEKPQNIDINWNSSVTYNITRIFAVNFTLDLIYDDDVEILLSEDDDGNKTYGQRLQMKEFLGFGLTYRLM